MTTQEFSQEDRDNYEAIFGPQADWADLKPEVLPEQPADIEPSEPVATPAPKLTHAKPGATPEGYVDEDEAAYTALFGADASTIAFSRNPHGK